MAMLLFGVLVILFGVVIAVYGSNIDTNLPAGAPLMIFAGIILAVFSQLPVAKD